MHARYSQASCREHPGDLGLPSAGCSLLSSSLKQPWASGLENRWANCRILPQRSAYYGETGASEWGGGEGVGEGPQDSRLLFTQLDNKKLVTWPRVPPVIVLENQGLQWVPKDKNL